MRPRRTIRMPPQRRGRSKQDYGTPFDLAWAIGMKFGPIEFDLAAHCDNAVVPWYYSLEEGVDSLLQPWHELEGLSFLNPPFDWIYPWARKCNEEAQLGAELVFLVPASVSTHWYNDWVHWQAAVYFLNPKVRFEGHSNQYPKDMMLCHFGPDVVPGFWVWKWKLEGQCHTRSQNSTSRRTKKFTSRISRLVPAKINSVVPAPKVIPWPIISAKGATAVSSTRSVYTI